MEQKSIIAHLVPLRPFADMSPNSDDVLCLHWSAGMELRERLVSGRSGRIVLEVRGRGNAVNLDLRRNDHVRADVPVLVARGGKLESWRTHPDNVRVI